MATYDQGALEQALITKGGYNQTDAANAAANKGGRAEELAREFLGGSQLTSDNLQSTLDNYQSSLMPVPEVKVPTAEELKTSLAPSTPAPTPISRTQLLEQQRTALGVGDLERELNTIKEEERQIQATLRATTGAEEGKPVALGVMAGRITEEQRQANQKLDFINVRKATVVDELNTKYNAINTYVQYAGLDYQDAVQAYNDDFNRNVQVQNLLSGFRQEAWKYATDAISINNTIKQNNIDNARANLTTITNAITSGNTTYANLPADQKLQIQKLEIQSGLPVGTIANMQLSAKDKILGWSDDKTQAMVSDGNGGFKIVGTGFTSKSGNGSGGASTAQLSALRSDIAKKLTLDALIKKYNNLSPNLVLQEYNNNSPWGVAKESAETLNQKYNITSNTTTKTTVSNSDINKAIQLARKNGATDDEIKQIQANPSAYVNDIISLYGD